MYNILVCDDDKEIVEAIEIYLSQEGYKVLKAYDGEEALKLLDKHKVDLLIIDVMMPRLDGIRATLKIREKQNMPIIILSAKSEDADKILGLNVGADDYVTKPFGMMELVSRVRALLRRTAATPEKVRKFYQIGLVSVDVEKHEVLVDGNPVTLTYKEFELLCYLMENEGIVLSRDRLLSKIWGYDFDGETRTVDVHILTLRQKLGIGGSIIETIRGVGYKADSCGKRE